MRFRQGFVSNSSSSNYIITIPMTLNKFAKLMLAEYQWCYFDKNGFGKEIDERIEGLEKDDSKMFPGLYEDWLKQAQETKKRYIEAKAGTDKEWVDFVLHYHGIICVEQEDKTIQLMGSSTCHNNFQDMPELLSEIALYFTFDTKTPIICLREDTQ